MLGCDQRWVVEELEADSLGWTLGCLFISWDFFFLRCNSYIIQFGLLKCTIPSFLVYAQGFATITII